MSYYTTGFTTGTNFWWSVPPPPPPPPVEIVFEHDGRRHRLLVTRAVLEQWLQMSAAYEAVLTGEIRTIVVSDQLADRILRSDEPPATGHWAPLR